MRGGYIRRIGSDKFNNYINKHSFPNDCCPCVMNFFGENQEFVDNLFINFGANGMSEAYIEEAFKHLYNGYSFKFTKLDGITSVNNLADQLTYLLEQIPNGYGIFGGYMRRDETRHCVVFAKGIKGEYALLDAQSGKFYINDEILEHLYNGIDKCQRVIQLFYLNGYDSNGKVLQID